MNFYPIQVFDLRFQVDHVNPSKIQLFEEYTSTVIFVRLFAILIRHKEYEMVPDANKYTQIRGL